MTLITASIYIVAIHSVSTNVLNGNFLDQSSALNAYGRYYIAINEDMPWTDATAYCHNEYGTTLATVITADDLANFKDLWHTTSGTGSAWIGLHGRGEQGPFKWDSQTPCFLETDPCSQFWGRYKPNNDSESCAVYLDASQSFNTTICTDTFPFVCDKVMESIDCGTLNGWNTVTHGGEIEIVAAAPCNYDNCIRISGDINDDSHRERVYVERDFELRLKEKVIIHYSVVTEGLDLSSNDRGFAEYFCNGDESNSNRVYFNEYLKDITHFSGSFDLSTETECDTATLRIGGDVNGYLDEIHLRAVTLEYVVPPTSAPSRAPTTEPTATSITANPFEPTLVQTNKSSYQVQMIWIVASGGVIVVLVISASLSVHRMYKSNPNGSDEDKTSKHVENHKETVQTQSLHLSYDVAEGDAIMHHQVR